MEKKQKYLSDILRSIELIEDFTRPVTDYNHYLSDLKTQSAVERQLGIIGEAVKKYETYTHGQGLKNAKEIVGFRNRLIHAYDAIDPSIVWAILKKHLVPLKKEVQERIQKED
jgi:uncharacterized protein with HEPN domain